jgi:hypothetical protein
MEVIVIAYEVVKLPTGDLEAFQSRLQDYGDQGFGLISFNWDAGIAIFGVAVEVDDPDDDNEDPAPSDSSGQPGE